MRIAQFILALSLGAFLATATSAQELGTRGASPWIEIVNLEMPPSSTVSVGETLPLRVVVQNLGAGPGTIQVAQLEAGECCLARSDVQTIAPGSSRVIEIAARVSAEDLCLGSWVSSVILVRPDTDAPFQDDLSDWKEWSLVSSAAASARHGAATQRCEARRLPVPDDHIASR